MKKETDIKIYKKLSFIANMNRGYSVQEASEMSFIFQSYGYKIQDEWMESGYD